MVVHRKEFEKQNVKIKKICFSYEKIFLHILILKIISLGLQKKKRKKEHLKNENIFSRKCRFEMKLS